jgi:autotransporter-associated beta strand protein
METSKNVMSYSGRTGQTKGRYSHVFVLILSLLFLFGNNYVRAAIITSTGAGGSWSLNTTWSGGIVPGAADDVIITSGATVTMDVNYITSATFTLNGTATLQLNGFNLTTGSLIAAGSSIINNSGAAKTLTTGSLNTSTAYTGTITGAIALIKNGTGALTLSGNNTYNGTTTLSAGTININNATAIGSGTFIISAGTTIDNTSGGALTLSNNNPQNWNGDFAFSGTQNLNLGTGAVTMSASRQVTVNGGILTIGGIITGVGFRLTKAGAGILALGGANTYTGGTTLTAGALQLNNTAALGANGAAVLLNGGTLDLATDVSVNAYNITVGGSATIASDKATPTSAGITHTLGTLSNGTFTLTIAGGSNVNSGTAGLTFGATTFTGAPIFTVNNPAGGGVTQLSVAAVAPAGNTATINGNGNMVQTGVWGATAGGITYSGTGTLTLNQANTFTGILTVNSGTVVGTSVAGALGAGTLTLVGGILKLSNAAGLNFGRNTTISSSAQIVSDVIAAGAGVTHTLGTLSIGNQTLTIAGGNNVTSGTAGLTFGATTFSGAPTFTINNPAGGGVTQLSVAAVAPAGNTATINGNGNMVQTGVWGATAGGITYSGTGTLTLNQANTFTGILTVNSGTVVGTSVAGALGAGTLTLAGGILKLTNAAGLNFGRNTTISGSAQIVSDVIAVGAGVTHTLGTLSIGNQTLTIAGGNNVNGGTAGLTFGATTFTAAPTFTVNNPAGGGTTQLSMAAVGPAGNTATINGNGKMVQTGIWGPTAGGITYSGTGSLTLSQANTYTGTTTLNSGQLNINNATAIGTGTFIINGGTIDNTTAAAITLTSSNPQTWNSNFTFAGTQNLNLGTGAVTMNASCQVTITTAKILTVGGTLSGASYNLTKAGVGILTMGANTVTINGLTINAGTLTAPSVAMNIAGDFSNSGTFTHNGGTVNYNGAGPQAVAGVIYNNLTVSNGSNKNLQGATTVAGTLSLTLGVIQLGNNNLTLSGVTGAAAITGVFSNTNMIETDGTGLLVFTNAALPGNVLNGTYPLGNSSNYNPVVINNLAGAAANRTFNIRVVTGQLFVNGVNRYWEISQSGIALTGTPTLSFKYNASEASSDFTKYQPFTNVTGLWTLAPTPSAQGVNPVTSTTAAVLPAISLWTAATPGAFYSYQSGAWNDPTTWTTDPGGTTYANPANAIPGYLDVVTILTGRTVSLTSNVTTSALDVTINEGGFLDLSTWQITAGLLALRGQGTLKLGSVVADYFPNAVTNTFVNAGGGTTEYNATINIAKTTHNNLTINTAGTVTLVSNISLNGNLLVKQGTFQINDASALRRQLTINGSVTVNSGASMTVGTGNTVNGADAPLTVPVGGVAPFTNYYGNETHRIVIFGDFINNGTVRFTNQNYPQYNAFPNNGAATVYFQGSTNNTLTCNGQTDFYNLVLDKGNDQTFSLKVYSSAFGNFRLFGANTALIESAVANPNIRKALWIRNGTLDLTGLITIPSLTEGSTGATTAIPTSDYFIPSNGAMILDGPFVTVLSTADDYTEVNAAYGLAGGTNALYGINIAGAGSGLSILGNLQVNNGYLSTRESSGLLYWSYAPGQFIMNGGTVDTKQFHNPEGGNTGLISYAQIGGNVIIRGRFQNTINYPTVASLTTPVINTARNPNGIDATAGIGTLSINGNAANGFTMSGGTISIYDVCGTTGTNYAMYVNCPTSNINITGGTVQVLPTTGTVFGDANYVINSLAPIGNLIINGVNSLQVQLNTNPLYVLKNLTIQSGVFNANSLDVNIGGDFTISNSVGTTYTTGVNNTVFNGSGTQTFTVNTAAALSLGTLKENKSAADALVFAGTQTTINIVNLSILGGRLGDNGNTINVTGNVLNSGTHYGTGSIIMNGAGAQTIGGNGSGIFNNLTLNNSSSAAPISLIANISVSGILNMQANAIFNIGAYNLNITTSGSITSPGFSATRYIHTNGQAGDGGITKAYSSSVAFVFPVGSYSTNRPATYAYTPATIGFSSAPTIYGSITVTPVGYEHPATVVNNQSLKYFWRIKSSGFVGIPANSVTHTFVYNQTDVAGTEANYIPSLYNRTTYAWNNGTTANPPINTVTNTITDWAAPTNSKAFLDADYTAGDNTTGGGAFGAAVKFYSIAGTSVTPAGWNSSLTWSHTSGGAAIGGASTTGVSYPGPNSIAVIENNHYILLSANDSCASLQIQAGSTLDIYTYTGSVFSMVQSYPSGNNGLFRLTTTVTGGNVPKVFSFPGNSDFSDFNNNHGTTEFYDIDGTTGALYILPSNVTTYGNLMVTAKGGDNLVLPNNALTTIQGDLTCGGDNANAWIAVSWNTTENPYFSGVYDPTIEKTVHVTGNLNVNTGTLIYMPEIVPQHIVVDGNVTIGANAWIDVEPNAGGTPGGPPVANTLAIGGNLVNNSTGFVRLLNGTYYCNVTFQGTNNASLTGTSPSTIFNNVTVNKGSSQATALTCDIGGTLTTPVDNWLTLQNGTFKYMRTNPNSDFTISTVTPFNIPSSASLYINYANSNNHNILIANNASNANTLYLGGKLTVVSGIVYVGPIAAPAFHNDIEYSSGGASTIQVDGGSLIVNGAIRRNPSNANGILNYTQTGGAVTINGNTALNTNAKLEVLNNGSQFNMSGASTLNIIRGGGGNEFGDLYLRPQTSSITGGTIIFAPGAAIGAVQNYQVDANIPLNNITITGFNAANAAKVQLMVDPLVLNGNLTLSNTNSVLNAVALSGNSINVTFNGNVINNGNAASYLYGTNHTTFSASNSSSYNGIQSITGTAFNYYDLNVNPGTSLTLNGSTIVNDSLTIGSGTLICGANKVSVLGNFTDNGNYTDNNVLGTGISLAGASVQHVAGSGTFSWLELNNPAGAVLDNSIALNEHLTLTLGIFNIKENLLTLQQNSTIDANGTPFSITKMVATDGVFNNIGIKKFFTTAPQSFTYPIGTSGKYTPAVLTLTASGYVGSVRINNVNTTQPTVIDPANALKYYWDVESSGISGFAGSLVLNYLTGDVVGGPESSYQSAWLNVPGAFWSINGGVVVPASKTITFNYPAGTENLSGEYTAGISSAFPANVPTYTSIADGNWNDPAIWSQTGGTLHTLSTGPNGFIVIVNNNVTTNTNFCSAYQTTINGKLVINASTYGHNFGTVTGNGTLSLQGGSFPAGVYTSFLDCLNNGTVEYGGAGSYTIVADLYDNIPNLLFSGTGTRILPDKDLTICNSFKINGPTVDNSVYNRHLTMLGTMERYTTGVFNSGTGANATVSFAGSAAQSIGGATGDFTGASDFNNLEINNTAGLTINTNGSVEVNGNLLLTNGLINTSTATNSKLTITNTSVNCVIPARGSASSYVNGPLVKKINQGDNFSFPIGQGNLPGNRISVSSTQTGPLLWTAQYVDPNSTFNSYAAPLAAVSWNEYWSVTPSSASQAIINLDYYPNSDITPLVTQSGLSDMRVAVYNTGTSQWNAITSTAFGDNYNGTISTSGIIVIPFAGSNYTLAAVTTILPKVKLSPAGPVCGTAGIPVTLSTTLSIVAPFTVNYTENGVAKNITPPSFPATIPTIAGGATYILTSFTYNYPSGTLLPGVVDVTPVIEYASPTTANAGTAQSVCGITSVTLNGNNPAPYTGTWSIISGAGGTLFAPNNPASQFNGILPNAYTLRWTISNGTCKSNSNVSVAFTTRPSPPTAIAAQSFCTGATISNLAAIANNGIVTWYSNSTYPPTPPALANGLALTTGTTYYADAVSGTCISAPPLAQVTVTLFPQPTSPTLLAKTPNTASVCDGTNVNATITAGTGGVGCSDSYQYRLDGGAWLAYTSGNNIVTTGHTIVDIQGQRAGCNAGSGCTGTPWITLASWTVTPNNTIALSSAAGTDAQTKCINTAITNITYTTTGATGASFAGLPAGVSGSWAANVVTISGTPTASGTFNYTVTLTGGCGNITASGSIVANPRPITGPAYREPNN